MKNKVGQPVRGDDFFQRPSIIKKIYRRLDSRSNLYMAAPRRVGKTSIMYFLEDSPRDGYAFVYVNTESVNDSEDYFMRLFKALLNSKATNDLIKKSEKAKSVFEEAVNRVKKIGIFGVSLELNQKTEGKYSEEFFNLVKKLTADDITIVLMVDEFPSTVENIHNKKSKEDAIQFLQLNREIRQESGGGLLMIYTGSIGLSAIVNRLGKPETINDLNVVEVPPLSPGEAYVFTKKLLESEEIKYEDNAIDYLLEKIEWLMPFFIQLTVQEIIDGYDLENKTIDKKAVEKAIDKIYNRRNKIHFDSYYDRLKDAFDEKNYQVALQILNLVASEDSFPSSALYVGMTKEGDKKRISSVLQSLEYDGYIARDNGSFRFNSPILREWWNRYVRN